MSLGTLHLVFSCSSHRVVSFGHSFLYSRVVRPLLIFDTDLRVIFADVLEGAWILSVAAEAFFRLSFLLGLEPHCSSISLSEFVSHWCPHGGLLGSSVEFTSLHSLFTLAIHFSVHIPYTRELYRRGAYLLTPILETFSL